MQSDFHSFIERTKPLIERAAETARRRASSVVTNTYLLWDVYNRERERLHFAAWDYSKKETVKPDKFTREMTRDEFEEYLLNLAVWVEEFDEEPGSKKSKS